MAWQTCRFRCRIGILQEIIILYLLKSIHFILARRRCKGYILCCCGPERLMTAPVLFLGFTVLERLDMIRTLGDIVPGVICNFMDDKISPFPAFRPSC